MCVCVHAQLCIYSTFLKKKNRKEQRGVQSILVINQNSSGAERRYALKFKYKTHYLFLHLSRLFDRLYWYICFVLAFYNFNSFDGHLTYSSTSSRSDLPCPEEVGELYVGQKVLKSCQRCR